MKSKQGMFAIILVVLLLTVTNVLAITTSVSLEELKSILSYSEKLYYPVSQFVFGKTGQYLNSMIAEQNIDQYDAFGPFSASFSFLSTINNGWKKYQQTSDASNALIQYLHYYESVINAFALGGSQSIKKICFFYLNNLSVFLYSLGQYDYYVDLNKFLLANLKSLGNEDLDIFEVKSYIYINRAVIKLFEEDYIAATHYFYLAHLVNSRQKEDILTLNNVKDKTLREKYSETKYFTILKVLLETPSVINK